MPTAPRESASSSKARLFFFLKILVTLLVSFVLIEEISPAKILTTAGQAHPKFLAASALLLVPNLLLQLYKWHYLLRLANPSVTLATSYRSLIVGFPLAFVTPGRLGEIGRALYVREIRPTRTFRLFVLDKGANFVVVAAAGGLAWFSLTYSDETPMLAFEAVLGLALTGFVLILPVIPGVSTSLKTFARTPHLSPRALWHTQLLSIAFYLTFLTQFVLLILSFQQAAISSAVKVGAAVFLAKTFLPISFSDLGIREGAAVYFGNLVDLEPAGAFSAAFSMFLINVFIPSLIGLPILWRTARALKT